MHYHLILTNRCNSKCKYCYEKSMADSGNKINKKFKFNFSMPENISYSIVDLKKFISKDNNPVLTFYGGEPLLEIEKIKEIIDNIPARYMLQTNGLLLNQLPKEYIHRLDKILISIDGNKKITNFNRGQGNYEKVMQNINLIKKNGYKGEIIARMTLSSSGKYNSIFKSVKHLTNIGFNSIHWQIDAGFYEDDYKNNKKEIISFFEKYNTEVKKLVEYWLNEVKKGNVLKIYPFLGIFDALCNSKKMDLQCGSGYANYTIAQNGEISACPIMFDILDVCVGNIKKENPKKLKRISIKNFCLNCEIKDICGGRCLYSNYAELWPKEGQELICNSIKNLIDSIKNILPKINEQIQNKKVSKKDFEYEQFSGPEIIP